MSLENLYCLTINDLKYEYLSKKFTQYGLPCPRKWKGFVPKELIRNKCEQCCLFGHMSIIMMARCLNLPYVCIFEEDAYPRRDVFDKINFYLNNKPSNCGILLLGSNGYGNIVEHGDYLTTDRVFGAHSYIIYKCCYDDVLNNMARIKIADVALSTNLYKDNISYICRENLFIQKNITNQCMTNDFYHKIDQGTYFYGLFGHKGVKISHTVPVGFEEDGFVLQ